MANKLARYEEYHFQKVDDVGVAFNHDRVWVCLNGAALFRAKVVDGKLFTEYYPPDDAAMKESKGE